MPKSLGYLSFLCFLMPLFTFKHLVLSKTLSKRSFSMSNKFTSDFSFSTSHIESNSINILNKVYNPSSNSETNPNKRNVFAVFVTGGGVKTMEYLLTVPGASNSMMETGVPYSRSALNDFLQLSRESLAGADTSVTPLGGCNEATAVAMARRAYQRALVSHLEDTQDLCALATTNIFGVGCTAALVSTGIKKGKHRVYIALYEGSGAHSVLYYDFEKGLRSRVEEDALCSQIILHAIDKQCNSGANAIASASSPIVVNTSDECPQELLMVRHSGTGDAIEKLYAGNSSHVLFVPSTQETNAQVSPSESGAILSIPDPTTDAVYNFRVVEEARLPAGSFVYPGSFNPLHSGHCELVAAAMRSVGTESTTAHPAGVSVFEIAAVNADKPSLSREVLLQRIAQFHPTHPIGKTLQTSGINNYCICVTSKPFFVDKSDFFPGCRFVIGADTAVRLIDSKYYVDKSDALSGDVEEQQARAGLNMVTALSKIVASNGCSFIVGGRVKQGASTPTFETWSDLERGSPVARLLPQSIKRVFKSLSEAQFRADISSTDIRNAKVAAAAVVGNK